MRCSLARALEWIGDWWTPLILRDLFLGVKRFDALAEDLGVSRNLLTRRLKGLEENGMILRRAYQERPRRFEYVLTEAGRDLVPILIALTAWGDRWAQPSRARQSCFAMRPAAASSSRAWSARPAARDLAPTTSRPCRDRAARPCPAPGWSPGFWPTDGPPARATNPCLGGSIDR